MNIKSTDIIQFKVMTTLSGNVIKATFPRVRNNFKYEHKPVYTNVNTSQTGVTSQTFVRDQIVISGINFDPITQEEYAVLADALNIGKGTGGSFYLNFFNFGTGKAETREFIVKSLPITVLTMTDNIQRIQLDSVSFQEV